MKYIANITRNYFMSSKKGVVRLEKGKEVPADDLKHLSDAILNADCSVIEEPEPVEEQKNEPKTKKKSK